MKFKHIVVISILVLSIISVIIHQIWPNTPIPGINIETNIGNSHQTTNNYYGISSVANPITPDKIAKIIDDIKLDTSRIPSGYFIALERMESVIIALIQNNFTDIAGMRPDVSVGNSFDAYVKKRKPELYSRRIDCTNLYKTPEPNPVPIKCYPMELASEFDNFVTNIYFNEQFPFYLAHLQRIRYDRTHQNL